MKRQLAIAGAVVVCIGIGIWVAKQPSTNAPPVAQTTPPAQPRLTYAEQAARWDETAWQQEVDSRPYGKVIEDFWDELRQSPDPWTAIESLVIETVSWPKLQPPQPIEHTIQWKKQGSSMSQLTGAAAQNRLAEFRRQGFVIEQSEWRHTRFLREPDGVARSGVAFTLHLQQSEAERRTIVRGELDIEWKAKLPAIHHVKVSQVEVLSRTGPTPFAHVIPAVVTPSGPYAAQEPNLNVMDLNHDGLAEIVVSRINRVYWNQGQGQFRQTPLCDFPPATIENGVFEDFDGDGQLDFLVCHSGGLALFIGTPDGRFPQAPIVSPLDSPRLENPFVITAADVDGDDDVDAWMAQYRVPYRDGQMPTPFFNANDGHPSYLLLNDGHGRFTNHTQAAGLADKRNRRTYSSSFVDIDADRDADLVVISDFAGIDVYENDGRGRFHDRTAALGTNRFGFGMAHTFADFDHDGTMDMLMIGMNAPTASRLDALGLGISTAPEYTQHRPLMAHGNRLITMAADGFTQATNAPQIAQTGWSWGAATGDVDNDGDEDLYIVNGHISGASVRDYDHNFWLYDIYLGTSQTNAALNRYFQQKQNAVRDSGGSFGGHELNRFFLNRGEEGFLEVGYLMGLSLNIDCRNLVSVDLDGDGRLEWLTVSFETWPKAQQALQLFPNFVEGTGNWIGAHIMGSPNCSVAGAVAVITTPNGQQTRRLLNGDSYRSQHAHSVHFGIGTETRVQKLTVTWPNGNEVTLNSPSIGQYHRLSPASTDSNSN